MKGQRRLLRLEGLFWVGFILFTNWMGWSTFRRHAPDASISDYLNSLLPAIGWVVAALAVLAVVSAVDARLLSIGPEWLRRRRSAMVAGLGIALIAAAVLIWVQSGWAALAIGLAIFMAVQTARATGLEPSDDPAAPRNQQRTR